MAYSKSAKVLDDYEKRVPTKLFANRNSPRIIK